MPRLRLTKDNVATLRAIDGKRTDYADTYVPGLSLRVSPSGRRSFAVVYRPGKGKTPVRVTLDRRLTLKEAQAKARTILDGRDDPADRTLTVSRLVADALAALDLRPSTRREWTRVAEHDIEPVLGPRAAADLERHEVRAWLRTIGQRTEVGSNRALTVLRRCYSWAVEEERLRSSPCAGLRKLYEEPSSERVLSADELRRLLGALARLRDSWPAYADATLLLLLTLVRLDAVVGMRRAELHDLDGREPLWVVPAERSKNGREHHVPLSPAAVAIIRRRLAEVDALAEQLSAPGEPHPPFASLFPVGGRRAGEDRPMTWSSNWIEELREEVRGVKCDQRGRIVGPADPDPAWTIHNLRKSTTHLLELGYASLPVCALLLGHTLPGPRVTGVYVRAEMMAERRAALARWSEWLARLGEDQRGKVLAFGVTDGVTVAPRGRPRRSGT